MNKQANKLLSYLESNPNFNKEILDELRSRWSNPEVRRQTQIDVVPEQTEDYSREA